MPSTCYQALHWGTQQRLLKPLFQLPSTKLRDFTQPALLCLQAHVTGQNELSSTHPFDEMKLRPNDEWPHRLPFSFFIPAAILILAFDKRSCVEECFAFVISGGRVFLWLPELWIIESWDAPLLLLLPSTGDGTVMVIASDSGSSLNEETSNSFIFWWWHSYGCKWYFHATLTKMKLDNRGYSQWQLTWRC